MSARPQRWFVKRTINGIHPLKADSFEDAVKMCERRELDAIIICNDAIVATWSKADGLQILNRNLAGRKS